MGIIYLSGGLLSFPFTFRCDVFYDSIRPSVFDVMFINLDFFFFFFFFVVFKRSSFPNRKKKKKKKKKKNRSTKQAKHSTDTSACCCFFFFFFFFFFSFFLIYKCGIKVSFCKIIEAILIFTENTTTRIDLEMNIS